MLRQHKFNFIDLYREEANTAIKAIVKQVCLFVLLLVFLFFCCLSVVFMQLLSCMTRCRLETNKASACFIWYNLKIWIWFHFLLNDVWNLKYTFAIWYRRQIIYMLCFTDRGGSCSCGRGCGQWWQCWQVCFFCLLNICLLVCALTSWIFCLPICLPSSHYVPVTILASFIPLLLFQQRWWNWGVAEN